MIQVKRTRRQIDQVLITSLLAFCLNYILNSLPAKADCIELDIDIDAACSDIGNVGFSAGYSDCAPSGYSNYSSGYDPGCASSYGSGYGSGYDSACTGSYQPGCQNTAYSTSSCGNSNPYNRGSGNYGGGQQYGASPIIGRNLTNYSTYDKMFNAGYGMNTRMGRNGGYNSGIDGENAEFMRTIRTPLIQGAPNGAPNQCPQEGQPPAIGHGDVPMGVNPGMGWNPEYPASHLGPLPSVPSGIEGKWMINGMVQPYLRPPTQNQGCDPGMIDSPPQFCQPPVTTTYINPQGGIQGDAPIDRWGGQTTRDFGYGAGIKKECSSLNDFGQPLINKPDLYAMPQAAQDGPRPEYGLKTNRPEHRNPNRENAQTTSDRQGNRTFFKGPERRSQATLANY